MFLEKLNVSDSLLFLCAAREALCNIIETSTMSPAETERTRGFLMNEASDYEVMSLIMEGELPEEKYNDLDESYMFEELKERMFVDAEVVGQVMGEQTMVEFISSVSSVFPKYSSAKPIMEYQASTGLHFDGEILSEVDVAQGAADAAANAKRAYDKLMASSFVKTMWKKSTEIDKVDVKGAVKAAIKKVTGPISKASDKAADSVLDLYKGAKDALKQKWAKALQKTDPHLSRMRAQRGVGGKVDAGYLDKLKKQAALPDWRKALNQKLADLKGAAQSAVDATKRGVQSAQQSLSQAGEAGKEYIKAHPEAKYVAGAALASLAIFAGYKTYKRYMSKAGKACKDQSGSAKSQCLKAFRKKAIIAQAQDTQASMAQCAKTKDPGKCKAAIAKKVAKLKSKASKL